MSHSIVRATEHLTRDGLSYEGCPLCLRDSALSPLPSMWLMFLWREFSPDTATSYAFGIIKWLDWLSFQGVHCWDVTIDDLSRFKRVLLGHLSTSSINVCVAATASFYKWASENKLIAFAPFKRNSNFADGVPEVALTRIYRRSEREFKKQDVDNVLAASKRTTPGICLRDELVAELGMQCGLRRLEIAALKISFLDGMDKKGRFYSKTLTETKGKKPRKVFVPDWLEHRLRRYISIYRQRICDQQRQRKRNYIEPDALFLTMYGKPLRRQYITAGFAEASAAAGSTMTFHSTRHIFATSLIEHGDKTGYDTRRLAQDLLGHSKASTTAIYDHSQKIEGDEPWVDGFLGDVK